MMWAMTPSSGVITTPSLGVITQPYDRHLHEKIDQLERWLLFAMESVEFELPEEMVKWKATYINRKKLERDERIAYLQEQTQKMLDELKRLQENAD